MCNYLGYRAKGMGFDAHLTIVYFTERKDSQLDEIREVLRRGSHPHMAVAKRIGFDLFGPERKRVPVVRVAVPPAIQELRKRVEHFSTSQYVEWNPHITLRLDNDHTILIPEIITLSDLDFY